MNTPLVSVIMPVYNTARYVESALNSVLAQTFEDFEILIIDDQGTDNSIQLCRRYSDPRIRIISQENRGLAGARNTGIRNARGRFLAFLDSDDLWEAEKLALHVAHLMTSPSVGVSYAASSMIDDDGEFLRIVQRPKLYKISAKDVFLRNPVGNGSAPVIRAEVFGDIEFYSDDKPYVQYFDETFRQSEDIECWTRIALSTGWKFEGLDAVLTRYRINEGGLSANVIRQFETWCRLRDKVNTIDPVFAKKCAAKAEGFQLRYLARRCIRMGDGAMALSLVQDALKTSPMIAVHEPLKTMTTVAAAVFMRVMPVFAQARLQAAMQR